MKKRQNTLFAKILTFFYAITLTFGAESHEPLEVSAFQDSSIEEMTSQVSVIVHHSQEGEISNTSSISIEGALGSSHDPLEGSQRLDSEEITTSSNTVIGSVVGDEPTYGGPVTGVFMRDRAVVIRDGNTRLPLYQDISIRQCLIECSSTILLKTLCVAIITLPIVLVIYFQNK